MIYDSVADKDRYECENIGGNVFQADGALLRKKHLSLLYVPDDSFERDRASGVLEEFEANKSSSYREITTRNVSIISEQRIEV